MGLLLACYPFLCNWQYQNRSDKVIAAHSAALEGTEDASIQAALEAARRYNEELAASSVQLTDPFTITAAKPDRDYEALLHSDASGLMCFIEIPRIQVCLPVYHGTKTAVLERGIGHLEGSSLPVGGMSTRTVLTGHSGLNRARLFSDLGALEQGDLFFLHTLGQTLAYRVVQMEVVLPSDACLSIMPGKDLCTLVTCTPYGINSHRLLVTGERTAYTEALRTSAQEEPEAPSQWMREYRRALCAALLLVAVLSLVTMLIGRRLHHE